MDIKKVTLSSELYWKVKAILKGVQMEQKSNKNITWGTTLDAVLEEMGRIEEAQDAKH